MAEDLDALRQQLRGRLPARIQAAAATYERFTGDPPPEDAKGFSAWHGAAKAALAHMELLIKLARWAEGKAEAEAPADGGLDRLLAEARSALDALGEDDDGEDEDAS